VTPAERVEARRFVIEMIPRDAICAEIGVWKGDFSEAIAKIARPRALHLIDPWTFAPAFPSRWYGGADAHSQADMDAIYNGVCERMSGRPNVFVHRLKSLDAATLFRREFDWIYVDGDHSYEAVLADLRTWWGKLKPGGILVCDDVGWRDEAGLQPVANAATDFADEHELALTVEAGQCIFCTDHRSVRHECEQ
jgi:hypothetical protein